MGQPRALNTLRIEKKLIETIDSLPETAILTLDELGKRAEVDTSHIKRTGRQGFPVLYARGVKVKGVYYFTNSEAGKKELRELADFYGN